MLHLTTSFSSDPLRISLGLSRGHANGKLTHTGANDGPPRGANCVGAAVVRCIVCKCVSLSAAVFTMCVCVSACVNVCDGCKETAVCSLTLALLALARLTVALLALARLAVTFLALAHLTLALLALALTLTRFAKSNTQPAPDVWLELLVVVVPTYHAHVAPCTGVAGPPLRQRPGIHTVFVNCIFKATKTSNLKSYTQP